VQLSKDQSWAENAYVNFVACAGAHPLDMVGGGNGLAVSHQMDKVAAGGGYAAFATMTVGGNEADFASIAGTCLFSNADIPYDQDKARTTNCSMAIDRSVSLRWSG